MLTNPGALPLSTRDLALQTSSGLKGTDEKVDDLGLPLRRVGRFKPIDSAHRKIESRGEIQKNGVWLFF